MGGTLVLIANRAACRKVVGRLRSIQGHAQSHIRFVRVVPLRKPDSGQASNIPVAAPCRSAVNDNVISAIRARSIRNRRGSVVAHIGIGIPLASGKGKTVAIIQVVDIVRRPFGLHKARGTHDGAARYGSGAAARRVRLGKRREHVGIHPLSAVGIVPGAPVKVGGTLVLVGHGPVRTRKLMALHPGKPRGGVPAHAAVTVGVYRTPFRDEHGKPAVHGTLSVRALVAGGVRARIKVERVGDILLGIRNLVADGIARVLVPAAVPHKHQVVGVLADSLDDRVGISLDGAPGLCRGLVEDFKDHVIVLAPLLRHVAKKLPGVLDVVGRLVAMVVDNHVDVVVDGRLHHRIHQALVIAFL